MNAYLEMKESHQCEVNAFPLKFAFSNKQFEEGMKELGLSLDDTDKVYKLGDTGGFYLRTDADRLHEMFDRHEKEMQDAIDSDITGEGFILEMFSYELSNHEYVITHDVEDALNAHRNGRCGKRPTIITRLGISEEKTVGRIRED